VNKQNSGINSRETEGKAARFASGGWLLLLFWLVTSGLCLLLCDAIATALCQVGTHCA
jgi:hypothetical protein